MTGRSPAEIGRANRRAGVELERATQVALEETGWFVLRVGSGQAGAVDLVALAPYEGWPPWAVQCKARGYLPPAEVLALRELESIYSLDPVVAYWHKEGRSAREVRFKDLEGNEVKP